MKTIGSQAFNYCTSLTSITVDSSNTYYKSVDGNLYSYDGTELVQYAIGKTDTSFEIPESVTTICSYAFYNSDSLTSVIIGNSVTSIGYAAFSLCNSLTSVYYGGEASDWNSVTIDSGNTYLTNATLYYYSANEPDYTDGYNYWYYDGNGEIVVWTT